MSLFEHTWHSHVPQNVNALHQAEQDSASLNARIAITLTRAVGTMTCAYLFAILAIIGFPGLHASPPAYVQWTSQTFIQLVMLSVIMVGQSQLSRKQELQADETYQMNVKNTHDLSQIALHLAAQDAYLQAFPPTPHMETP